jgi:transcriptional regulator with XRE-family HTH domain
MSLEPLNPEWFAGRLRELRQQAGFSREALAERAGMNGPNGIRNLEQGIRMPSWETVVALCQALGVKCDAFLQEPSADLPPSKPGRPHKSPPEADDAQAEAPDVQTSTPPAAKAKKGGKKRKGK